MPIGVRDEKDASVVAWAGWDASMLDALLDSETGPDAIGFTLARVLATRLLPSPAARFRFRLYRYCHETGTYEFVGAWNERCLEEDARPVPPATSLASASCLVSASSPREAGSSKLPKRTNVGATRHTMAPISGAARPS